VCEVAFGCLVRRPADRPRVAHECTDLSIQANGVGNHGVRLDESKITAPRALCAYCVVSRVRTTHLEIRGA